VGEEDSTHKFSQPMISVEWKQELTTTYMSLRRDFALSFIPGLRNVLFCVIRFRCTASTRGLKRIPIDLPSRFHRERYQHLSRTPLKRMKF